MRYSYSNLSTAVKCPRQWAAIYRDRRFQRSPSPALERGNRVHKALENALLDGSDPGVWTPNGLLPVLRQCGARAEAEYCIDRNLQPCPKSSPNALLLGFIDVEVDDDRQSLLLDWKTGKFYPDSLQADVYAVLKRAQWGDPSRPVEFCWVYVDQKLTHVEEPDERAQDRVLSLIEWCESATGEQPPKPSPLCRFCPVQDCEYYQGG